MVKSFAPVKIVGKKDRLCPREPPYSFSDGVAKGRDAFVFFSPPSQAKTISGSVALVCHTLSGKHPTDLVYIRTESEGPVCVGQMPQMEHLEAFKRKIGPPSVRSAWIWIPELSRVVGLDGLTGPFPTP